jgi:c-di-GMP-binding flagellar brake protein YcgR
MNESFETIFKCIFILSASIGCIVAVLFLIVRWQNRKYEEISMLLEDLKNKNTMCFAEMFRRFDKIDNTYLFAQEAFMVKLRQIEENTKHLNFKTQLLEMKMEDHIKAYHLTPVPTPKQVQVIQRRRRARSNKKPPIARGPNKDLV